MKYRKVMDRRTFLRGAGTVAIALPFLEAMRTTSVYAAAPEPPLRAFNLFFGLGYPTDLQEEGYDGPLKALEHLSDKLLVARHVDHVRVDIPGDNAHFDGATSSFNGALSVGETQSGGATIDQLLRRELYPNGQPEGILSTLLAGTYFRRSRPGRYIHCWNENGTPADLPEETPQGLFTRIFGEEEEDELTPEEQKRLRYKKSILDSVVPQYQHYMSDAGNLGTASKARISDHLDKVREYELKIFGEGPQDCEIPPAPAASMIPHGDAADPDGEGIDITVDELVGEWRLMAELYAMGVVCDVVRVGGLTFQAAGERIRLSGNYTNNGFSHDFDDFGIRGVGGAQGCSHEYWHEFNKNSPNEQMRAHLHLMLAELGYFMELLDDPNAVDENGLTILQNSLVSISTESGDGRHNDPARELSGIFHAFTTANERLRTGIVDVNGEGLDVYNTIIRSGYNLDAKLGPEERPFNQIASILA